MGFGVWGLGFRVWGLGFGVWGFGFRVGVEGFRACGVQGIGGAVGSGVFRLGAGVLKIWFEAYP